MVIEALEDSHTFVECRMSNVAQNNDLLVFQYDFVRTFKSPHENQMFVVEPFSVRSTTFHEVNLVKTIRSRTGLFVASSCVGSCRKEVQQNGISSL